MRPGALRISPHTDFEVLTLLFQSAPGLEICPGREAGGGAGGGGAAGNDVPLTWRAADPMPGCITVNIGDALQYLTDGRLRWPPTCSAESAAFFVGFGLALLPV